MTHFTGTDYLPRFDARNRPVRLASTLQGDDMSNYTMQDVQAALQDIAAKNSKHMDAQKARLSEFTDKQSELQARMLEIEQIQARGRHGGGIEYGASRASPAAAIVDALMASPSFEGMTRGELKSMAVMLPQASTIISTAPIVDSERDRGILRPLERRLTVRDLLPVIPMTSGSVEYTRETAFTNNADIQASEGDAKAESAMTFDLVTATARTIAHWIPASRQVLDDRAELMDYVENRLLYGLKFKEEAQLLLGSGVGVNLHGIYTQATAYTRGGGTKLDVLRKAITQLQLAEATPSGIVLNPEDWEDVELGKATDGQYITVTANNNGREIAWRLPVVVSNSQPAANFLIGDFARGAAIRDRQEARVEVSREHSDFFTRNLIAILAEERIALAVFRPIAFVKGSFGS